MQFRTGVAVLLAALTIVGARAQTRPADGEWPNRPVRLVVPFPAGASTDVVARIVARRLSEKLGQSVVIENKVGASGDVGSDLVAKSRPDGYTLGLATTSTHAIAASLNPQLPYDPVRDFTHVAMIGVAPYALVVFNELPAKNVAELIALAKSRPAPLTYSTVGPASLAHLAGDMFASMTGAKLTAVPYGSASQAVFDVLKGIVDMQFGAAGASLPLVREGKLRALAVTSARRTPSLPDTPTLAEAGLAGYDAALWMAIMGPANLPAPITARLNAEINAVLAESETRNLLAAQVVDAEPGTAASLRDLVAGDVRKWRELVDKTRK